MTYNALEEQAFKRIASAEDTERFIVSEIKHEPYGMSVDEILDAEADEKLDIHCFRKPLNLIEKFESKIREMKLSGLSGSERKTFEQSLKKELLRATETAKAQRIRTLFEELDKGKRNNKNKPSSERLLDLEMSKLKYSLMTDEEKSRKFSSMATGEFSEVDLLLLSQDENYKSACQKLLAEIPPEYSSESSRKILKELELLSNLRTGQIALNFKGAKISDSPHIFQLINSQRLQPTIRDTNINLEGISI